MSGRDKDQPQIVQTSLLFDKHAIWVLLFLLLAAIWYKFIPLIVISVFLLVLFIIVIAWKSLSLKNIKPTIQLSKSRLFVDEKFLIKASVHNDKFLPLIWLEWSFPSDIGIRIEDNEEDTYTIRLLWLLSFQKVKWTLEGKALQRGVFDVGHVTLRSGDGFRFAETEELFPLEGKLFIYPKLVAVDVSSFRPSKQWGVRGKQGGIIEDPLLVIGIREYQSGDEIRRLNWRASARTGKWQTNVSQPVVTEQLVIYIDVQGYVINEAAYEDSIKQQEYLARKRESFEWFLSLIASVAVKHKQQGISIGFSSNGLSYSDEKMTSILPSRNLTPFLDKLAQITQRVGVRKMSALDEMLTMGQLSVPLFIFCHHVTEEHYLWFQQNKKKLSEVCFYYQEESEYNIRLDAIAKSIETLISVMASSGKGSDYDAN